MIVSTLITYHSSLPGLLLPLYSFATVWTASQNGASHNIFIVLKNPGAKFDFKKYIGEVPRSKGYEEIMYRQ